MFALLAVLPGALASPVDPMAAEILTDRPVAYERRGVLRGRARTIPTAAPLDGRAMTVEVWFEENVRRAQLVYASGETTALTVTAAKAPSGHQIEVHHGADVFRVQAPTSAGERHLVLTFGDHRASTSPWTLYLDGVPHPLPFTSEALPANGTWSWGPGRGRHAGVALYDTALDPARVVSHRLVRHGHLPPTPPSSGQPIRLQVQSGGDPIDAVLYSPDGRLLAVRYQGPTLQVWDTASGLLLHQWGRSHQLHDVAWAPDGRRLAIGTCRTAGPAGMCDANQVEVLDVVSGEVRATLPAGEGWIDRLRFSPSGTHLAASGSGQVWVWDPETGREVLHDEVSPWRVPGLRWNAAGTRLGASGENETTLYDLANPGAPERITDPQRPSGDLTFLPSGDLLLLGKHVEQLGGPARTPGWSLPSGWLRQVSPLAIHQVTEEGALRTWDLTTGEPLSPAFGEVRLGRVLPWRAHAPSPRGTRVAVRGPDGVDVYQTDSGAHLAHASVPTEAVRAIAWRPDGRQLAVGSTDGVLHLLEPDSGRIQRRLHPGLARPEVVALDDAGRRLAVWTAARLQVFDLVHATRIASLPQPWDIDSLDPTWVTLSWHGDTVTADHQGEQAFRWDLATGTGAPVPPDDAPWSDVDITWSADRARALRVDEAVLELLVVEVEGDLDEADAELSVDLQEAGLASDDTFITASRLHPDRARYALAVSESDENGTETNSVRLYDRDGGEVQRLGPLPMWVSDLRFADSQRLVVRLSAAGGNLDEQVVIWDLEQRRAVLDTASSGYGLSTGVTPSAQHIAKSTPDGRVLVWDRPHDTVVTVVADGNDWLIHLPDASFTGSANAERLVGAAQGWHAFGVDQLALTHNRPHDVMATLGAGADRAAQHYARRFEARLRRAGLEPSTLGEQGRRPEVRIRRVGSPDPNGRVTLDIHAFGGAELQTLQVYAQGVPLLDPPRELTGKRARESVTISLTAGATRLEATVLDKQGRESLRALEEVTWTPSTEAAPDLWFVGFGVSDYADDRLDLAWAHKDALDLGEQFGALPGFRAVHVHTSVNHEVTPARFDAAREALAAARPHDVLVLFVAGHGVHDDDGVYRFLPHGTDPDDLPGTAVSFERIERLLVGASPRRKLFLIDTCESGERDGSDVPAQEGITVRGARGLESVVRRAPVRDRDRFIYTDLLRRSGTIVLSSSSGTEVSFESAALQQGQFTHAVRRALQGHADQNADGMIDTDELRRFVAASVSAATQGAQNPRVDRDNLWTTIAFPALAREE